MQPSQKSNQGDTHESRIDRISKLKNIVENLSKANSKLDRHGKGLL